jgi:hypothetical protein
MIVRRAMLSSVAKGSLLVLGVTTGVNKKTDLQKYEQKHSVRAQTHERRRPTFE